MAANLQRTSIMFGICLGMLTLTSCLSTTTAVSKVQAYDSGVIKEQLAGPELPQGIHYTWSAPLPNKTSVKKSYFMILALIKEGCTICLKEASREITDRTKDSLRDYYRHTLRR